LSAATVDSSSLLPRMLFLLNNYLQDWSCSKAGSSVQKLQCCHFYLYIYGVCGIYVCIYRSTYFIRDL